MCERMSKQNSSRTNNWNNACENQWKNRHLLIHMKKQTQETRLNKILFCSPYLPRELGAENRDKMTRFQLQISFNIHERSMENDREDEEWSKDIIDLLGRTTSTFGKYSKWKINNWNEFQILMMFWINEPMSYSLSWELVTVWLYRNPI